MNPLDCFSYYSPATSEFHEVELDDISEERGEDTKVCAKKVKIGAKLDISGIVKLAFDFVESNCTNENNAEKGKAASAGAYGAAASRGTASTDKNGLAVVRGNGCKAKGGIGTVIVIVNEHDDNYDIAEWKAGVIDGETLKPDTWYRLENGEFVECEE